MPSRKVTEVVIGEVQSPQPLQQDQRVGEAVQPIMAQVQHLQVQEPEYRFRYGSDLNNKIMAQVQHLQLQEPNYRLRGRSNLNNKLWQEPEYRLWYGTVAI